MSDWFIVLVSIEHVLTHVQECDEAGLLHILQCLFERLGNRGKSSLILNPLKRVLCDALMNATNSDDEAAFTIARSLLTFDKMPKDIIGHTVGILADPVSLVNCVVLCRSFRGLKVIAVRSFLT